MDNEWIGKCGRENSSLGRRLDTRDDRGVEMAQRVEIEGLVIQQGVLNSVHSTQVANEQGMS